MGRAVQTGSTSGWTATLSLYDGEGTIIRTFDLSTNTQGPDFATAPNSSVFALRVIPDGTFKGDVLAADSAEAVMFELEAAPSPRATHFPAMRAKTSP